MVVEVAHNSTRDVDVLQSVFDAVEHSGDVSPEVTCRRRTQCHTDAMATGMTRGGAALRYALASVLLIAAQLGSMWFHSAGVYQGDANVPLVRFPQDVDFFYVLTFAPSIIGLKYLAYDFAVRAFTKNYGTRALSICFFAGYSAALAMDVACLFAASRPVADAGLSVLGAIVQSPLVLFAVGGAIAATVLLKDKPPHSGPAPSSGR